ncbi:MAG: response regulator [Coriobacteriia bacterium]|nr:response regulator [Coriobacteriia bacterium]
MQKKHKQIIMLVDDNKTNLAMGKNILGEHYNVYPLPSAAKLFEFLGHVSPDLILLDIDMPGMNGYEALTLLKADQKYADIPVIFVTAKSSESDEYEGLALGAIDYITKPFSPALLLRRIENHLLVRRQKMKLEEYNNNLLLMVKDKTQQVYELLSAIMHSMADLVEFRDQSTGQHICRTQEYLRTLVEQLIKDGVYQDELSLWDMDLMLLSSPLHDVGKIAISDTILNKPGKLSDCEYDVMKTHAQKGVEILERMESSAQYIDFLEQAKLFAGAHHEKWDGSGYPFGLSGLKIPLEGRIMAIADVYDALVSVRPYKKAMSAESSAQVILDGAGAHFDPLLVKAFRAVKDEFAAITLKYADAHTEDSRTGFVCQVA